MTRILLLCLGMTLLFPYTYAQPAGERLLINIGGSITSFVPLNQPKGFRTFETIDRNTLIFISPLTAAYYTPGNWALFAEFSLLIPGDRASSDSLGLANLAKKYGGRFYYSRERSSLANESTPGIHFRIGTGYRKVVRNWHFAPKILFGIISTPTYTDLIGLKEKNTNVYYDLEFEQKSNQTPLLTLSPAFAFGLRPGNRGIRFNFEIGYTWMAGSTNYHTTLINQLDKTNITQLERQHINNHYLTIGGGILFEIHRRIRKKGGGRL